MNCWRLTVTGLRVENSMEAWFMGWDRHNFVPLVALLGPHSKCQREIPFYLGRRRAKGTILK
jgi:hypothetical protein